MNNKFTRKEVRCPLNGDKLCNRDDKDCFICMDEEEKYQVKQCRLQMGGISDGK